MKRAAFGLVLLLAATIASADNRTRTLTRGLADALYCQLAGTCTVQTLTVTGTCTGCVVTSVSVVSANGFAGTVATATTTPAITLTATPTGILKSNGTAISAATSGTDYSAGTSSLATGILKSTTTTGGLTIAVAGDFPTLNQSTSGTAALATAADHTPTACGANTFAQSQSTAWAFTCVGLTFAGAQFANQGTTTTVAHGNASGNPSWAKVVDGDITFTAPTLGAPTATTIQTSGNIGLGVAPSATAGAWVLAQSAANESDSFKIFNTDASGTSANAAYLAQADTAGLSILAHGTGRVVTRFGVTVGGYTEVLTTAGNGLLVGTFSTKPVIIGTNSAAAVSIDSTQNVTLSGPSLQSTATKTLTESSATAFVVITVANSSACSGYVSYTVFAADATNTQAKSGQLFFSTVANSSGAVTKATISDANTLNPVSSGTLTNTMTDTTGTNTYTLLANAVSSLTQTTLNIKYLVRLTSGQCTVTAQ